jgi:hypothetical protein
MQGAILTQTQAAQLLGQFYAPDSYFNPFLDINASIYISIQEIEYCVNPDFQWVKQLTISTIVPYTYQPPYVI